ncbi:MAG TPA: hypothetical protein VEK76_09660 [Candidatus Binatia bacterium]|nr:hypothetical protein [Candidatus Binatia bacterium]
MTEQDFDDGYPPSAADDLRPGLDELEPLDLADEALEAESVAPGGHAPDGSPDEEDELDDAHDADELAQAEGWDPLRHRPSGPDRANFSDNLAEWSRTQG